MLKREEADGSSETDVEDDYVKADEKTTVNTFFQESEEVFILFYFLLYFIN